jgi:DNA (cytosine-5)-methyltransferase 1
MISNVETQRKRVGLTQIELSERVGVSRRALSSIEKSVAIPSVDIALKLALALNTSVEDLFSLDEDLPIENNTPTTLPLEVTSIPSPSNKWEEFTFIDLFAGIGGIRLGFESVGGRCVFSSEFDEDACKTYEANFGEHPSGDITKIDAADIPDFDILLGGFPCQAFSIIGKKEGFANETCGTLFFDIERILKEKRPKAFMLENVRNLVAHDNGNTFRVIKEHLEALGYTVHAKVLNALDYGVPQKRERIIIVGFQNDIPFEFPKPIDISQRQTLADILEENVDEKYYVRDIIRISRLERLKDKDYPKPYISHENMAGSVTPHPYSSALRAGASANYILVNDERRPTEREMLRIQGFPDTFKIVLPYGKIKKQCGNSVAVPVIKAVAAEMLKSLRAYDID